MSNCKINKLYIVKEIKVANEQIQKQLENCEIEAGAKIKIILTSYKKQTYLVKVNEISYGLSKKICDGVIVYEA